MPRNLDMEISALRKGWGEWCEEYTEQERRLRDALDRLRQINELIYAAGAPIGSTNYSKIRALAVGAP